MVTFIFIGDGGLYVFFEGIKLVLFLFEIDLS